LNTIRSAVPSDADAIGSIWLEAWRVGYRGIVPDDAIARRTDQEAQTYWRAALTDPERAYFVVVAETPTDGVVGFAQAGPCEPEEPGYDFELWKLYIREASHRRGIGRMLIATIADRLAARHALFAPARVRRQPCGRFLPAHGWSISQNGTLRNPGRNDANGTLWLAGSHPASPHGRC
jgi:GNAT superfamily N-acetyltransferase